MPRYTFVRIPENAATPLEEIEAQSDGFDDDALRAYARAAFKSLVGHDHSIVKPGDALEITLLTTPTVGTKFASESLYSPAGGRLLNERATAIARACGHINAELRGDVFLGRCVDDERGDRWFRLPLTLAEATTAADWVVAAAAANRGKSLGTYSSGGLQAALQNMVADRTGTAVGATEIGGDAWICAADRQFSWRQRDEEVEVRVPVPKGTKAKDVTVVLTSLRAGVRLNAAEPGMAGALSKLGGSFLYAPIIVADSAWVLEDDTDGTGRLISLTLAKATPLVPWPSLLMEN